MSKLEYLRMVARAEAELESLVAFERSMGRPNPVADAVAAIKGRYPALSNHPMFRVGSEPAK